MWHGDYLFLLRNLVVRDFKIRYRNMSLGLLWSLLNPLVLMTVLALVFTKFMPNTSIQQYPVFLLCGLVPYNFFSLAWNNGTTSIASNATLIKRVPVPREIIPIASVLSNCTHLLIQIGLLLGFVIAMVGHVTVAWLWLPVIWLFLVIFVCGMVMTTAALDVYVRDMRYVVESAITLLFWLVPIVYSSDSIPPQYRFLIDYNPIAAVVVCMRIVLINAHAPELATLMKLALCSCLMFAIGWFTFRRMKDHFFDYL